MSEHTEGPWLYGGTEVHTKDDLLREFKKTLDVHTDDLGQYFLEVFTEDGKRIAFIAGPTGEANARRIVSCVNACEGIPKEHLEYFGKDFLVQYTEMKTVERLVLERHTLLSVLSKCVPQDAYKLGDIWLSDDRHTGEPSDITEEFGEALDLLRQLK